MWGRLFTGTDYNEELAEEFNFARRFASLNSQDPEESSLAAENIEDDLVGRNKATPSQLFKNIRKELDSIVSSNPSQFLPEMNEVDVGPMVHKSSRGEPKKRRAKVTFIRRIPNGRSESSAVRSEIQYFTTFLLLFYFYFILHYCALILESCWPDCDCRAVTVQVPQFPSPTAPRAARRCWRAPGAPGGTPGGGAH